MENTKDITPNQGSPEGSPDEIFAFSWEKEQSSLHKKAGVQDPYSFRMLARARRLSRYLLQDGRPISLKETPLYADSLLDEKGLAHMQRVVDFFLDNPRVLDRFRAPVCNEQVRILICDSLDIPPEKSTIDHFEVRAAVLSALLFPLRQRVGSCFATAPAILIQSEQYNRFLDDFFDLIVLGKIRRTKNGESYSVPINATWGAGDLRKSVTSSLHHSPSVQTIFSGDPPPVSKGTVEEYLEAHFQDIALGRAKATFKAQVDHALLKSWEYTLASFADYKTDFAKWNLFASLGFDHTQQGGIGEVVYAALDEQLNEWNKKLQDLESEHNTAVDRVRMAQSLLSQAYDAERQRRHQAELSIHLHHLDQVKVMIDETHDLAKNMAGFYKFLMEHFQTQFQEHFQEVYDPDLHETRVDIFDDSPAGFRLVFKHGREDPSLWTHIYSEGDFVKALVDYFILIEPGTIHACEWERGKDQVAGIIGLIIEHVKQPLFLKTALARIKTAHKKIEGVKARTPWSYVAGGSLDKLIEGYFSVEGPLTKEARPVENTTDLAIFLIDLFKGAAPDLTQPFLDYPEKGLLMYSPTHAFILKPGDRYFVEAWQEKSFTYTWIRDKYVEPARRFYKEITLNEEEQGFFFSLFGIERSPKRHVCGFHQLRACLCEFFSDAQQPEIDSLLCFIFPIFRRDEWRLEASLIIKKWVNSKELMLAEKYLETIDIKEPFLPRNAFVDIVKQAISHATQRKTSSYPFEQEVYAHSPPFLTFADTNWAHYDFAFGYNPGSDSLDLWRLHQSKREGFLMSPWNAQLNGTDKRPWGVLIRPFEYGGFYTRSIDIPRYKI